MSIGRDGLSLRPLANIEVEAVTGASARWAATSGDPQCEVVGSDGKRTLRSGWYSVSIEIEPLDGAASSPVFYPDYGHGYAEDTRIALPEYDRQQRIETLILLQADARALRFDPSTNPLSFRVVRFSMRRLGRLGAAVAIARRTAEAQGRGAGLGAALGPLYAICRNVVRYGRRRAGEIAYREYAALAMGGERDYRAWLNLYDLPLQAGAERLRAQVESLPRRPTFSIVVPVYNTHEKWLRSCIDSVLEQAYPDWELCIADDASPAPHVRKVLQEYAARDPRVKVVFREKNGHISAASNSALEVATGEFCALLDHDDLLPKHALLEMAAAIVAHPRWKVIYSDEDKIDEEGNRYDPYFKPDWNYDLFLSQNCISHLGVYSTALLREVGGFRQGLEGSQDWDLALRCIEKLEPDQIGHVPKVLYHWRAIPGSTALGVGEKSYAHTAALAAIGGHLERRGEGAKVEELPGQQGRFRVRYPLPEAPPRVSLIVPTRDKIDLLECCISSILERSTYPNYEILVVDNGSVEAESLQYFARIAADPRVKVLPYPAPFNYSAINNYAAALATGSVLGFVNNDIEVIAPDWLEEMVAHSLRRDVGAVGAMLYYPDDTIQHAGVILGLGGIAGHRYASMPRGYPGQMGRAMLTQELTAVTAACMLMRREVFESVRGFDEGLAVAFNDIDLCLRIRQAGFRNLWTPFAELYHHESASRGYEDTPEKIKRFQTEIDLMRQRWSALLPADPAHNVNLPLVSDGSSYAFPPRDASSPIGS